MNPAFNNFHWQSSLQTSLILLFWLFNVIGWPMDWRVILSKYTNVYFRPQWWEHNGRLSSVHSDKLSTQTSTSTSSWRIYRNRIYNTSRGSTSLFSASKRRQNLLEEWSSLDLANGCIAIEHLWYISRSYCYTTCSVGVKKCVWI